MDTLKSVQIRRLRAIRGLTQKELADMIDATVRQVGYWEKGKIALADAAKVADALECSLDELAGRKWPKDALDYRESELINNFRDTHDYFKPEIEHYAEYQAARHPKKEAPGVAGRQMGNTA